MKIKFPYSNVRPLEIGLDVNVVQFALPKTNLTTVGAELVSHALRHPIGNVRLALKALDKKKIVIISDDISRPTPTYEFIGLILDELHLSGVKDQNIDFLMALGSHRPMTKKEMAVKLGANILTRFRVHNHEWDNQKCLKYIGDTNQGVPVSVNRLVSEADLVIGLGAIMPIEVCGFSGGGKIVVPGVCGENTNSEMHWARVKVPSNQILGKRDNPIRKSIDSLAKKAGLDYIVNVILDENNKIAGAVAGDVVAAHRAGCKIAKKVYGVKVSKEFDIVIADSFPFDIEFWQANKALDTTGVFVKKGGVVILVSPCYEGFSKTHSEILEFGYLPKETVKTLVKSGKINHKVVGVHMIQVAAVAIEKAKVILVSEGISKKDAEKVGLLWAQTPQKAFEMAVKFVKGKPRVAILKQAARMLPIKDRSSAK